MSLHWDTRTEGIDDLEGFFDYAGYKARDLREPLHDTKDYIQGVIMLQLMSDGEYRSGGWEELSHPYAVWKDSHGGAGLPILELTGEMAAVVEADESWHITMTRAIYEPPSELAGWHQEGVPDRVAVLPSGEVVPNPLPSRPILELWPVDYDAIEGIWERWLDELRFANARRGVPDASIRPRIFG